MRLLAGLSELGWIEGRNVVFEHRFPDSPERVPARSQRSWSPSGWRSSWWRQSGDPKCSTAPETGDEQ
jgi:hypothetical protein